MIMKDRTTIREREERLRWEKFQVFFIAFTIQIRASLYYVVRCARLKLEKKKKMKKKKLPSPVCQHLIELNMRRMHRSPRWSLSESHKESINQYQELIARFPHHIEIFSPSLDSNSTSSILRRRLLHFNEQFSPFNLALSPSLVSCAIPFLCAQTTWKHSLVEKSHDGRPRLLGSCSVDDKKFFYAVVPSRRFLCWL